MLAAGVPGQLMEMTSTQTQAAMLTMTLMLAFCKGREKRGLPCEPDSVCVSVRW